LTSIWTPSYKFGRELTYRQIQELRADLVFHQESFFGLETKEWRFIRSAKRKRLSSQLPFRKALNSATEFHEASQKVDVPCLY
jgi:hypothetical protein